jgi:hypothetical protein
MGLGGGGGKTNGGGPESNLRGCGCGREQEDDKVLGYGCMYVQGIPVVERGFVEADELGRLVGGEGCGKNHAGA